MGRYNKGTLLVCPKGLTLLPCSSDGEEIWRRVTTIPPPSVVRRPEDVTCDLLSAL